MADIKLKNVQVETLSGDLLDVVGDNKDGIVKKIVEEEEIREKEIFKQSPAHKKNIIFVTSSIVLSILAFCAVFAVFLFRKQIFTVPVTPQFTPIIFTDKAQYADITDLDKEHIIGTVINEINSSDVKSGGIEGIYFSENKKIIGLKRFLELLEASIDKTKMEFFKDNFLAGISNKDTKDFFILIQMRSTTDVFDVMRAWEEKMFFDLHKFFGVELSPDTKYLLTKDFEDGIIQNKNARILHDTNGRIVLMYVYLEDGSLLVTNSEATVGEVITRLASARVKK